MSLANHSCASRVRIKPLQVFALLLELPDKVIQSFGVRRFGMWGWKFRVCGKTVWGFGKGQIGNFMLVISGYMLETVHLVRQISLVAVAFSKSNPEEQL